MSGGRHADAANPRQVVGDDRGRTRMPRHPSASPSFGCATTDDRAARCRRQPARSSGCVVGAGAPRSTPLVTVCGAAVTTRPTSSSSRPSASRPPVHDEHARRRRGRGVDRDRFARDRRPRQRDRRDDGDDEADRHEGAREQAGARRRPAEDAAIAHRPSCQCGPTTRGVRRASRRDAAVGMASSSATATAASWANAIARARSWTDAGRPPARRRPGCVTRHSVPLAVSPTASRLVALVERGRGRRAGRRGRCRTRARRRARAARS